MLAIAFTFPSGHYHATPWDRHVNEGSVAWPPEPWRILRALIATWHHKVRHGGRHDESAMRDLIESLAQQPPDFLLPAATHAHTRHYMPQSAIGKTTLVLDAFAVVPRDEPLIAVWPSVELPPEQRSLLDELLVAIGYLGRAESWVEARRLERSPTTNCRPADTEVDPATGEVLGETVTLYAALPPAEYAQYRQDFLSATKTGSKFAKTLPDNLVDALSVDTADLRKLRWSQPPAARKVRYLRPLDALKPQRRARVSPPPVATTARFILTGKPLPQVEDSLRAGELLRLAVMGRAKQHFGEDAIPAIFSGHGLLDRRPHGHAFYLAFDSNADGRLDRLIVHVPEGMDVEQQRVLGALNRIWNRHGDQWRLTLEGVGDAVDVAPELAAPSAIWRSVTPYLHPWHLKKRLLAEDQIRRECRQRGLPEPVALERIDHVNVGRGRRRRAIHFRRFRSRRGLKQPDRLGSFWRLTFREPISGPLALGFACHFGLGMFAPD